MSRLLLKVGKIVEVRKHPDADSLYINTVELAEDRPRTIISGLVKHVPIEQVSSIVYCIYLDAHHSLLIMLGTVAIIYNFVLELWNAWTQKHVLFRVRIARIS